MGNLSEKEELLFLCQERRWRNTLLIAHLHRQENRNGPVD